MDKGQWIGLVSRRRTKRSRSRRVGDSRIHSGQGCEQHAQRSALSGPLGRRVNKAHPTESERSEASMALQRYEPYREMISLRDAMNSLFQDSFVRPLGLLGEAGAVMLPLDVIENENEFVIRMSLPGVRPEDVHIT